MKEKNKSNGCLAIIGVLLLVYLGLLILTAVTDLLDAFFSIPYINYIILFVILVKGFLNNKNSNKENNKNKE